jgi:glutamate---cysteine ligase / carboxylate-amine ligase
MSGPLHLFEGFGIELEYMLVATDTLDVSPVADRVLQAVAGEVVSDVEQGDVSWSNELALHVIELKTTGPVSSLDGLGARFQENVDRINELLAPLGGRLMPSAMHPWMDPLREMKLWPHDSSPVYEAFNRIFDCTGHGWANLQSVHLNLPFANDEEFGRLHAAIRLLLPLLPALSASSPIVEGRVTGLLDSRLEVYRTNAARIPSVTGLVVPEPVFTRADYETTIFQRLYRDIAPHDPEGILQHEWLNARGAITRFDRNTIEIRVLDVQECPQADLAICAAITGVLQLLVSERLSPLAEQQAMPTEGLHAILMDVVREGERAEIVAPEYLRLLGMPAGGSARVRDVWKHLLPLAGEGMPSLRDEFAPALKVILEKGPLARRLLRALGEEPSKRRLEGVYRGLCDCLAAGRMFGDAGESPRS